MTYRKAIITLFTAAAITALTACGGAEKPGETKAPVTAAETTTAAAPETPKGAIESWGIFYTGRDETRSRRHYKCRR